MLPSEPTRVLTPDEEEALLAAGGSAGLGYNAAPVPPPAPVEPGMYEPSYSAPGAKAPTYVPSEPGIYEPTYTQPGQYATPAPSTVYGGPVWPPLYNGTATPSATFGPRKDAVQVMTPGSGQRPTYRLVPSGGTEIRAQGNPDLSTPSATWPYATSRGQVLEDLEENRTGREVLPGSASPVHPGPSAEELLGLLMAGDPTVTTNAGGRPALVSQLNPPRLEEALLGLFGSGRRPRATRLAHPPPPPPARVIGRDPMRHGG